VSPFTAGTRLHDRFVLVERIGMGGMSQVWRATDEVLGRPVAVKTLAAELVGDPALREATWREARAAARLTHPSVARMYDYGEAPLPGGGRAPYLVMELVEGESLAGRLADGPLPWPEAARIGAHAAAALAAAHELGVVHHDVKPANVMLTAGGTAKVLDFGTAALVGAIDHDVLVGTPSYTAPERLEWTAARPASDVYSLGVLLYESLTGEPPAALDSWDEATAAHRAGPAPRTLTTPDLPPELVELVRACLSPDPTERPPARRAAATLARLAGIADPAAGIPAEPPTMAMPVRAATGTAPRPVPRTRVDDRVAPEPTGGGGRRLLLAGLLVTGVVIGLVVGLVAARSGSPDSAGPGPGPGTGTAASSAVPASTAAAPTGDARTTLQQVDRTIRDARADGLLDRDTARRLQDRVRDADRELNGRDEDSAEDVRERVEELVEEIDELEEDGDVPAALATELRTLLAPLAG
jgi:eukaryotic-like serine/threonine-protein kinase